MSQQTENRNNSLTKKLTQVWKKSLFVVFDSLLIFDNEPPRMFEDNYICYIIHNFRLCNQLNTYGETIMWQMRETITRQTEF